MIKNFDQIKKVLNCHGYSFLQQIGSGSFSNVFLCKSDKYNQLFAIKRVFNSYVLESEYNALISLDHPLIIKLYETFKDENSEYLVMEYCPNKTLKQKKKLEYDKFVYYAKQILDSLSYCHSNKIAHRDIKPDNIFLDQYDRVKLADFGFAKHFDSNISSNEKCGSLMYCAPEIINNLQFDPYLADVWALGITFFYMATGKCPFTSISSESLKQEISFGFIDFTNTHINREIKSVIQKMTVKSPKSRASIDDIKNLPIFNRLKEISLKKTSSLNQFGMMTKLVRKKSYFSPTFISSDYKDDDKGNITLIQSHSYKSSIEHSCALRLNSNY